ncbi:hypothetical protein E3U55_04030 [Filobacillus milosensis]|uniref:Cell wall elongation regulator TseB-like domain-containing protein n=1 Tax=Filobacillus milosensis TaxID=94137 RepID=A0A4Y8IST6_9BACI|nr:DUF5590 domain-containing protein [Filobacillus milosensis]TFB23990.1 hypothetical protein E3U55_04030 [Filobacillus milosensis]
MSIQFSGQKFLISIAVIFCAILFTLIITFIYLFTSIQSEQGAEKDKALEEAKAASSLEDVNQSYIYNGDQSYYVFTGNTPDQDEIHVFVPQGESGEVEWTEASEGLTQEEMKQKWSSACEQCDLLDMNLGIMNNRYIWEIIYEKNNRLYFQTFRFINGELYDSISFLNNK